MKSNILACLIDLVYVNALMENYAALILNFKIMCNYNY